MKRATVHCMFCGTAIRVWRPATVLGRACPRCRIMPTPETDMIRARSLRELREQP